MSSRSRNQLFADIAKFIVNFDTLCLEDKFLLLLSSQQLDVNLLVRNYVNKCFESEPCIRSSNRITFLFFFLSFSLFFFFYQVQFCYLIQKIIPLLFVCMYYIWYEGC